MKKRSVVRLILVLALVLVNISCDQVSKEAVRDRISENEYIHVIEDMFILTKVENVGAAMSLGSGLSPGLKTVILKILPLCLILVMFVVVLVRKEMSQWSTIGWAFIIGGGIGNIYDRLLYDSVTDFMYIDLGAGFHTGIFNMADVSVVVGTLLVVSQVILDRKKKKETVSTQQEDTV